MPNQSLPHSNNENPLDQIEKSLCHTVNELNENIEMREIYEIMMIKCEYVDEFATVLHQIMNNCSDNFRLSSIGENNEIIEHRRSGCNGRHYDAP